MTQELYKATRPTEFSELVGDAARHGKTLSAMLKKGNVPHTILFSGESGNGKTTLARILANKLGCVKIDLRELNTASDRGIDAIRAIQSQMQAKPLGGTCRVWIIDEAHELTKSAQNAFLKSLEDTPEHVYFFIATTEPKKLIKAIRTRCTEFAVKRLKHGDLISVIKASLEQAGETLTEKDVEDVAEFADGSARRALVIADQLLAGTLLDDVAEFNEPKDVIEIARAICNGGNWAKVSGLLRETDAEPETIRRVVLGYATAILSKATNDKAENAYYTIRAFENDFFDSGKAKLFAAAYLAVVGEGD